MNRRMLRGVSLGAVLLLSGGVVSGGVVARAGAVEPVTASPGYQVAVFATGLQRPTALAFGPLVSWGGLLYALDRAPAADAGRLVAIDPDGLPTPVAEGLQEPSGLVLSTGGSWGSFAYVVERHGVGPSGLRILRISPLGTVEPFSAMPGGARAPGGLVVSPGGAWGETLYVSDAAEAEILAVSPTGRASVYLKELSGPRALALTPPGSPFSDALYVATGRAVLRVGLDGQQSVVAENLRSPGGLAFGAGDALGRDLYLAEGGLTGARLLRVAPSGVVTVVATGFGVITGLALAPAGPFGPALYVADARAGMIYRVTVTAP